MNKKNVRSTVGNQCIAYRQNTASAISLPYRLKCSNLSTTKKKRRVVEIQIKSQTSKLHPNRHNHLVTSRLPPLCQRSLAFGKKRFEVCSYLFSQELSLARDFLVTVKYSSRSQSTYWLHLLKSDTRESTGGVS